MQLTAPPPAERRGRQIEQELRTACADLGLVVTHDGTVSPSNAAMLLHRSEKTSRNWRTDLVDPRYRKRGGKVRYAIEDLAEADGSLPLLGAIA